MKKYLLIAFYFFACFIMLSCSKNARSPKNATKQISVNAEVASGETYLLNLSQHGNHATITKQAGNFTISEVRNATGNPSYAFSYDAKSTVSEQVVIAVTNTNNRGCNSFKESTIVTVNFSLK
jgi:hypothetical protein